ncbi:epididymal-specific lipocalin-12 isoform X3 [Nycticebus coucang]|uniref:epididymal-specific lipocalin-12 isoform X3 n=1 Tax=Nycticebus coucang TaxID=9470 RepID=UPI00234E19CE|nr:epididymal-specific lipocalin-12 isoform X3 [Nycticebus coucang]
MTWIWGSFSRQREATSMRMVKATERLSVLLRRDKSHTAPPGGSRAAGRLGREGSSPLCCLRWVRAQTGLLATPTVGPCEWTAEFLLGGVLAGPGQLPEPSAPAHHSCRGRRCNTWSYVLVPAAQPGHFMVDHNAGPGPSREEIQVVDSDYTHFALLLSRRQTSSLTVVRVSLLGRNWALPTGTMDKFFCLGRTQGLSERNVAFPDLAEWQHQVGTC